MEVFRSTAAISAFRSPVSILADGCELMDARGHPLLRVAKRGDVDAILFDDHPVLGFEGLKAGGNQVGIHIEVLGTPACEFHKGEKDVPIVIRSHAQHVPNPSPDPFLGARLHA